MFNIHARSGSPAALCGLDWSAGGCRKAENTTGRYRPLMFRLPAGVGCRAEGYISGSCHKKPLRTRCRSGQIKTRSKPDLIRIKVGSVSEESHRLTEAGSLPPGAPALSQAARGRTGPLRYAPCGGRTCRSGTDRCRLRS